MDIYIYIYPFYIYIYTVLEITSRINSDRGYWYQSPWDSLDHRTWNQHKPPEFLQLWGHQLRCQPSPNWVFLTPKICSEEVGSHLRGTSQRCRQTVWPQDLKWVGNGSAWPRIDGLWWSNIKHDQDLDTYPFWMIEARSHPSSPIRCDCFLMASWGDVWLVESPFTLATLWYSNMANWEIPYK